MAWGINRGKHWYRLLKRSVWPLFAIPVALFGNVFAIRDEFLSPSLAAKLKMPEWLPAFPWYYWTILVLILVVAALLEGAYREHIELEGKLALAGDDPIRIHAEELRRNTAELQAQREANSPGRKQLNRIMESISTPRPLNIVIGTGTSFEQIKATTVRDRERTFYLKVENTDQHKPLTNCKLDILSVTPIPDPDRGMPWTLAKDFTLAAGEHKFVKFARYEETTDAHLELKWRKVLMVIFSNDPQNWLLLQIKEQTLKIRATSPDSGYCDITCKLWVDENWRFRIEKV